MPLTGWQWKWRKKIYSLTVNACGGGWFFFAFVCVQFGSWCKSWFNLTGWRPTGKSLLSCCNCMQSLILVQCDTSYGVNGCLRLGIYVVYDTMFWVSNGFAEIKWALFYYFFFKIHYPSKISYVGLFSTFQKLQGKKKGKISWSLS